MSFQIFFVLFVFLFLVQSPVVATEHNDGAESSIAADTEAEAPTPIKPKPSLKPIFEELTKRFEDQASDASDADKLKLKTEAFQSALKAIKEFSDGDFNSDKAKAIEGELAKLDAGDNSDPMAAANQAKSLFSGFLSLYKEMPGSKDVFKKLLENPEKPAWDQVDKNTMATLLAGKKDDLLKLYSNKDGASEITPEQRAVYSVLKPMQALVGSDFSIPVSVAGLGKKSTELVPGSQNGDGSVTARVFDGKGNPKEVVQSYDAKNMPEGVKVTPMAAKITVSSTSGSKSYNAVSINGETYVDANGKYVHPKFADFFGDGSVPGTKKATGASMDGFIKAPEKKVTIENVKSGVTSSQNIAREVLAGSDLSKVEWGSDRTPYFLETKAGPVLALPDASKENQGPQLVYGFEKQGDKLVPLTQCINCNADVFRKTGDFVGAMAEPTDTVLGDQLFPKTREEISSRGGEFMIQGAGIEEAKKNFRAPIGLVDVSKYSVAVATPVRPSSQARSSTVMSAQPGTRYRIETFNCPKCPGGVGSRMVAY